MVLSGGGEKPACASYAHSDGDGFADGEEVSVDTDPANQFSLPAAPANFPAPGATALWIASLILVGVGAANSGRRRA